MTGRLSAGAALDFLLAGDARFTLVSKRTGARYTFRVHASKDTSRAKVWFVSLLTGSNNEGDYTYLGILASREFRLTAKSRMDLKSPPVAAIKWLVAMLVRGVEPQDAEIWHEGHCGRCGRLLTVPDSITTGYGPECAKIVGRAA